MLKAQAPLPISYSPTIMPLTFALFYNWQSSSSSTWPQWTLNQHTSNAPLPHDADWIVTTLEHHIAIACGLDPAQEYRIANALYGLPDSGRIFYLHYKNALLAEGYPMSAFDNCLFYRINGNDIHNRVRRRYVYF